MDETRRVIKLQKERERYANNAEFRKRKQEAARTAIPTRNVKRRIQSRIKAGDEAWQHPIGFAPDEEWAVAIIADEYLEASKHLNRLDTAWSVHPEVIRYGRAASKRRESRNRKDEPGYRQTRSLCGRMRSAARGHKSKHTKELIGCTSDELRAYIEKQFTKGMTWENYGIDGWHIDHIMPCSSFDLTREDHQRQCFHFTNLRPLWALDNIRKGCKIITHQPQLPLSVV